MTARSKRGERPPPGRHRVTERDLALLCDLARLRIATTAQLGRLHFGARSALHRRLRALRSLGLIRTFVTGLNDPDVLSLSARGAELVLAAGMAGEEIHRATRVEWRDFHAELIGDLRVGFVLAARRRGDLDLVFWSDHDLRRALGRASQGAYIPDALVALRVAGEPLVLAYEIDRGEEPLAEVGRKAKVTVALATRSARLYGYANWRPVLLVPTWRRLRSCASTLVEAGAGDLWAMGLLGAVDEPDGSDYALAIDVHRAREVGSVLAARLVPEQGPALTAVPAAVLAASTPAAPNSTVEAPAKPEAENAECSRTSLDTPSVVTRVVPPPDARARS